MKKKLTNNIGLKILSLLVAIGLWLVVINIEDPVSSQSFSNIPVTFSNPSVLTDQGLVYEVQEGTGVVRTITVYGPRSVVEQLSSSDVVATADFNNLTAANTIPVDFNVSRFPDKITKIKGSINTVKLSIEKEKTIRLVLKVSAVGDVAEGYILGNMTPDQNQIIITGAESVVNRISKAVAEVDVTDATANIATYADVMLLDSEGNEIVSDSITQKVTSVRVSVEVLTTKRVPLSFNTSGTPADGYALGETIESNPSLITVAGSASVLKNLSRIDIPAEEINVTGQRGDMNISIDVEDYLPAGVSLAEEDFNGKVSVIVHIEPATVKNVLLYRDNVTLSKEIKGYNVVIDKIENADQIKLSGLDENVSAINAATLTGMIDPDAALKSLEMSEWSEGTYEVPVSLDLPEGVTLSSDSEQPKATITLKKTE